jgi:hypothetical protein
VTHEPRYCSFDVPLLFYFFPFRFEEGPAGEKEKDTQAEEKTQNESHIVRVV